MPLSPAPGRCLYCYDEEKQRLSLELDLPEEEILISEVLENTADKFTSRCCLKCGNRFCSDHASPVDASDCCYQCLPYEDITEMRTPLVSQDDTGTHIHRGYRIVPTGVGYKTLPAAISQMSDDDLNAFINEKANQLRVVEKQRDFLRVAQSTAKLEKSDREVAASRILKGIKIKLPAPTNAGIKITGKTNGVLKGVQAPAGFDLADFLKFVTAAQAAKKSGSSPSQPVTLRPTQAAPPKATDSAQGVTVGKGGGEVAASSPPETPATPVELARDAEIEAILAGGEPTSDEMKKMLEKPKAQEISDDDIPF